MGNAPVRQVVVEGPADLQEVVVIAFADLPAQAVEDLTRCPGDLGEQIPL